MYACMYIWFGRTPDNLESIADEADALPISHRASSIRALFRVEPLYF